MKGVFWVVFLALGSSCIEVNLPLAPGQSTFITNREFADGSSRFEPSGILSTKNFVSARGNDTITSVSVRGHQLWMIPEQRENPFKFIVMHREVKGREYVAVIRKDYLDLYAFFYIVNDTVYDLIKLSKMVDQAYLIEGMRPGDFIMKRYNVDSETREKYKDVGLSGDIPGISEPAWTLNPDEVAYDINMILQNKIIGKHGIYTRSRSLRSDDPYERDY